MSSAHRGHPVGSALRAVKVFVSAAFRVVVLGEYAQESGVRSDGSARARHR